MKTLDQLKYLTFVFLIVLLGCEIYLRIFKAENMVLHQYPKIYRFDPDPNIGYRGVPNIEGYIRRPSIDKHFRLNNFGFYGPDFSSEHPDSVFRIIIVGSSTAQGMWANQKESFATLLNDTFKKKHFNVEVINCAISGASRGVQNIKTAIGIATKFKPNLILYELGVPLITINYSRDNYNGYSTQFTGNNLEEFKHSKFVAEKKVDIVKSHRLINELADYSFVIRFLYRKSSNSWGTILNCWKVYAENSAEAWLYYAIGHYDMEQSLNKMNVFSEALARLDCKLLTFEYGPSSLDDTYGLKFSNIGLNVPLYKEEYRHELDAHPNLEGDRLIADGLFKFLKNGYIPAVFFPK